MNKTKIAWCDYTWNPITGCTPISEGCQNCYAKAMAKRFNKGDFSVKFHPERIGELRKIKKESRIFVCSMGDLFHERVRDESIKRILWKMVNDFKHQYMLLTKRPDRMKMIFNEWKDLHGDLILPHYHKIMIGVSVENQKTADERIPILLSVPTAARFISVEPMLGPIDLNKVSRPDDPYFKWRGVTGCIPDKNEPDDYIYWNKHGINWVICGGETGPKVRPMNPEWARSLRDQCKDAGIPFFMKQMSGKNAIPEDLNIREFPVL